MTAVVVGSLRLVGPFFIRDGPNMPKLARRGGRTSAWSSCSHERERVEALPLAPARGYSEAEVEGRKLSSKWFDQMPRGLPRGCLLHGVGKTLKESIISCAILMSLIGFAWDKNTSE